MLERIIAVLFPVFAISALGYWVARRNRPNLSQANRLNADVFTPALVFAALSAKSFQLFEQRWLALAMLLVIAASGVLGYLLAKPSRIDARTLMPTLMYGNTANLGIPITVLAFGEAALHSAVLLFVTSMLVQFSFGAWLYGREKWWQQLWRSPLIVAALAGFAVSLSGITVWPPLLFAIKMVGDISIPLMLFALGARLTEMRGDDFRIGLLGGAIRPAVCMALSWLIGMLVGLQGRDLALLLIYGALPPAVMNFIIAERYAHKPEQMAAIVLVGNLLAVLTMPIALALVLGPH